MSSQNTPTKSPLHSEDGTGSANAPTIPNEPTGLSPTHVATPVGPGQAPASDQNPAPTPQPVRTKLPITFQPNASSHIATPAMPEPAPASVQNAEPTPQPVRIKLSITFQSDAQMHYCSSCKTFKPRNEFAAGPFRGREVRRTCEKCNVKFPGYRVSSAPKRKAKQEADKALAALKPDIKDSRMKKSNAVDDSITYGVAMPKNQGKRKPDKSINNEFREEKASSVDSTVTGMSLSDDKTLKTHSQPASARRISVINNQVGNLSARTPQTRVQDPDTLLTEATARPPALPPSSPAKDVKPPNTLIRFRFSLADITPDILHYTLPTTVSTEQQRLEDATTRFALATHLQMIEPYYRPQITLPSVEARKDLFKEVDQVLKLTEKAC